MKYYIKQFFDLRFYMPAKPGSWIARMGCCSTCGKGRSCEESVDQWTKTTSGIPALMSRYIDCILYDKTGMWSQVTLRWLGHLQRMPETRVVWRTFCQRVEDFSGNHAKHGWMMWKRTCSKWVQGDGDLLLWSDKLEEGWLRRHRLF